MLVENSPRPLTQTEKAPSSDPLEARKAQAREVARDFEALFTRAVLKSMRSTAMPEDASNAMDIYYGMLDDEYAKAMSESNLGVGKMVYDWMMQTEGQGGKAALAEAQKDGAYTRQMAIQSYTKGL